MVTPSLVATHISKDGLVIGKFQIISRLMQKLKYKILILFYPSLNICERLDFHGECDIVYIQAPTVDLEIHMRTTIRYDYSFISSAAIRIGNETLQVNGFGDYMVSGVLEADLSHATLGGYSISNVMSNKKMHKFEIALGGPGDNDKILIKTCKDWVSVAVHSHSKKLFGDSVGLLGSFITGKRLARDGSTVLEDPNEFGQEWQVRDTEQRLFHTARAPQYPSACKMPEATTAATKELRRRRLGAALPLDQVEEACDFLTGKAKEACIYDVVASNDLEMAQAGYY